MKMLLIMEFIKKLSEVYSVSEIYSDGTMFDIAYQINPKKLFFSKFMIGFFKNQWEDNQDEKILNSLEKINVEKYGNKPTPWIIFVSSNIEKRNLTYFNGTLFVHIIIFDEIKNKLMFDNAFHYYGAKHIRNAIEIFKSLL